MQLAKQSPGWISAPINPRLPSCSEQHTMVVLARGTPFSGRAVTQSSFSKGAPDTASSQTNGAYLSRALSAGKVPLGAAVKHESRSRKHLAHHCGFPLHHLPPPIWVLWWEIPGTDWGRGKVLKLKTTSCGSAPTSLPFPAVFLSLRLTSEGVGVPELQGSPSPLSLGHAHHFRVHCRVGRT